MSEIIEYPTDNYNSWATHEEADTYFEGRLNSSDWISASEEDQIAAMLTAFRSVAELNITLTDLEDDDQDVVDALLDRLQEAQFEQALWELQGEAEGIDVSQVGLGGLLQVCFQKDQAKPERFSPRAMAVLRPYLYVNTITRIR